MFCNLHTHGCNILDVVCTSLSHLYHEPRILPGLTPDNPAHGAPSDHFGVEVLPIEQPEINTTKKIIKYIRPLPDSLIDTFRNELSEVDFSILKDDPVDSMVQKVEDTFSSLLHRTFPENKISINENDKPWFTEQLRTLKRRRMREYSKNGKSRKYIDLRDDFNEKAKCAVLKYIEKLKIDVLEGRRGSVYPSLRKLSSVPGVNKSVQFYLPNHTGLKSSESAEIIAEHFAKISQEYQPLTLSELLPNIQLFLSQPNSHDTPQLSPTSVYSGIVKARKPIGTVAGDLPKRIVQKCADLLAVPASIVFNEITRTSTYPSKWKIEHQIAIPKKFPPENEDDLRNIAKTPFLSKVYESFLAQWLLDTIKPYLDPQQCGLKGSSISHYLIQLLHFIHSTLDMKNRHAVLTAYIDLSKAFNRVDHTLVIQDLYDMHTPSWLLKIIVSYLSGRTMTLTFHGAQSSLKELPAGSPQGALLGGLIFMIKFNGIFLRPAIPRPANLSNVKSLYVKYVDDGAVAARVDLKACLAKDPVNRPFPLNFRERTGHILPCENSLLQHFILETHEYANTNNMIINKDKTNLMLFSKSRKYDFPPEVYFNDGTKLEVVSEQTLLGVVISEDLRWSKNTDFICSKARRKLWVLRRMMTLDLDVHQLFDVFKKEIRSILEYAVPVWHSSITK